MIGPVEVDNLLSPAMAITHGVTPRRSISTMVGNLRLYWRRAAPKPGEAWMRGGADRDGSGVWIVDLPMLEASTAAGDLPWVRHSQPAGRS